MMQGQPLKAISVNNLMKLAERICKVAMTNLAQLNTKKNLVNLESFACFFVYYIILYILFHSKKQQQKKKKL